MIYYDISCLYCRGMYARLAQVCQQALSPGRFTQVAGPVPKPVLAYIWVPAVKILIV